MGSKGALQPPAPVATWRALLEAPRCGRDWIHMAVWTVSVWRPTCPCGACVLGSLAGCLLQFRLPPKPQEATRRAPVSCAMYSACPGENEEHHFVTYRIAGSYVVFRVAMLYVS